MDTKDIETRRSEMETTHKPQVGDRVVVQTLLGPEVGTVIMVQADYPLVDVRFDDGTITRWTTRLVEAIR
jgi:hypothetical protein